MKIVLLPGLDGTGTLYQSLQIALTPYHQLQVVAYPLDQLWGYNELLAFIKPQLPKEPFVLIAESFSGPLGIMLAATAQPLLKGLVLCCTFASNPLPAARGLVRLVDRIPWNEPVHHWTLQWLEGRFAKPELSDLLRQALSMVPEQTIKYRAKQVLQVNVQSQFEQLTLPVMYLQAKQDRLIWRFNARNLQRAQPKMRLVVLDAPHFLLQAAPEIAATALCDFVDSLQSPGQN